MAWKTGKPALHKAMLLCGGSMFVATTANAAEVTFKPVIEATATYYDTQSDSEGDLENQALLLNPSLLTQYNSRLLNVALNVSHTKVMQDKQSDELDKSFTDYQLNSRLALLDQRLQLQLNTAQRHRALTIGNVLISDPILNADELVSTRTDTANVAFSSRNPAYLGVDVVASGSQTRADQDALNQSRSFNNDNINLTGRLYQGREFDRVFWDITSQYSETTRRAAGDFKSNAVSGRVGVGLYDDLHFIVRGSDESNRIEGADFLTDDLSSTSYGAGLEWRESADRFIAVTYNRFERRDQEEEYVGFELDWAFSRLTSVQASYDKSYFGDNYRFALTHNNRAWRSRIGYSEGLTTYDRLQLNTESLGVFVCPLGSPSLEDCFQPDSPNYEPGVDEQFFNLFDQTAEITDEVVLRKSGFVNLGYQLRKLTLSANYTYGYLDYLETSREQRNRAVRLSAGYRLGPRTQLSLQASRSQLDGITGGVNQEVERYSLTLNREMSPDLELSCGVRYLDSESENAARTIEDTRFSVTLKYRL
ncbi:TIGR03016 family PEP-CTERM system-associated outer membrane protein [Lacimicrobium sp. SS2-24]|uniref:TIGR03016 family PEP-CTERM system-associated outer membrane protein n=1 Tax=Lacimicrobium sp. SS2-24 TaxID=2005569 RepID=UPI000B4B725A|nr:TIGR03016 family PEP-CTERM system-associated outer membrane protein [Lacimicrobium sp. SS2-24]